MTVSAFDAWLAGLQALLAWPDLGFLAAGVALGAMVGILPGVGGPAALALLMPVALGLAPGSAIALIVGMAAVTTCTGDLTSILLGVPGEATSAAVVVDGHAMARRGEAARAVGASLAASLTGSVGGALALGLSIPLASWLSRRLASPELFMLALLGITLVPAASGTARLKGLVAGGIGLLLGTIGLDALGASPRFTFGNIALWEGVGAIPVLLGLFAIPEIVSLSSAPPGPGSSRPPARGLADGFRDVLGRPGLVLGSSAIGAAIGLVPAVGASISQWIAYGQAARMSRQRTSMGQGAVEGVIAPSAASAATLGGALVPTLAFGVPGSLTSAMLLSVLVMKGVTPGPRILLPESQGGHLTFVFELVWLLAAANVLAVLLAAISLGPLIKVTRLRGTRLVPCLLLLTFVGAFAERHAVTDLFLTGIFGALGLALARHEWPRTPVLMGLVLGPLVETRFSLSMDAYGTSWLLRPGVLLIGIAVAASLALPGGTRSSEQLPTAPSPRGAAALTVGEMVFGGIVLALLGAAFVGAGGYPERAAVWPRGIAAVTMALLAAVFASQAHARPRSRLRTDALDWRPSRAVAWVPIFLVMIWSLGFLLGAPLAVLAYLLAAGERPGPALLFAGSAHAFVNLVMFRLLSVPFPEGALFNWAGSGFQY